MKLRAAITAGLDGVASLVENNLVRSVEAPEGEPRFAMLETIREYGLERLSESGEEAALRRRHTEHWMEVAEQVSEALSGPDPGLPKRTTSDPRHEPANSPRSEASCSLGPKPIRSSRSVLTISRRRV